jgi:hypothetical protein
MRLYHVYWLSDYWFSSDARIASSSLLYNVIVNAVRGDRRGPGTYRRQASVNQGLADRNNRAESAEGFKLYLKMRPAFG